MTTMISAFNRVSKESLDICFYNPCGFHCAECRSTMYYKAQKYSNNEGKIVTVYGNGVIGEFCVKGSIENFAQSKDDKCPFCEGSLKESYEITFFISPKELIELMSNPSIVFEDQKGVKVNMKELMGNAYRCVYELVKEGSVCGGLVISGKEN